MGTYVPEAVFHICIKDSVFIDPACGSGNFLTETYVSLRRLENDILRELQQGQIMLDIEGLNPIKVGIDQFYGIEINDFAVTVAKTALWIAESQMMQETEDVIQTNIDFLPLKTNAHILEENALRYDWNRLVHKNELSYIMGNPPFVGVNYMSEAQREDMDNIWSNAKRGKLDYVTCWYVKSAQYMAQTSIRAALVSTNSISQGEQATTLWKTMFDNGVHIDFAHRTFQWDSEASLKAHVHCVIVGFSCAPNNKERIIYTSDRAIKADTINGYLLDAPIVVIDEHITTGLIPIITTGSLY